MRRMLVTGLAAFAGRAAECRYFGGDCQYQARWCGLLQPAQAAPMLAPRSRPRDRSLVVRRRQHKTRIIRLLACASLPAVVPGRQHGLGSTVSGFTWSQQLSDQRQKRRSGIAIAYMDVTTAPTVALLVRTGCHDIELQTNSCPWRYRRSRSDRACTVCNIGVAAGRVPCSVWRQLKPQEIWLGKYCHQQTTSARAGCGGFGDYRQSAGRCRH